MASQIAVQPSPGRSVGRMGVGIATIGRPEVLVRTLSHLRNQSRPADRIIVCAPRAADVAGLDAMHDVLVIVGPHGLPRQRNAILAASDDCDTLIFFDDDFLPAIDYLAEIERVHRTEPGIAMTTGAVVRDGIIGPGLTFAEAEAALAADPAITACVVREVYNGYGCNMSVDLRLTRGHEIRFDEGLPLYGWLEDVDFSRRIARHGRVVSVSSARGVHLGIKSGRQSGVRLGYSQIANPLYLARKGSFAPRRAAAQILRNLLANLGKAGWPEAYVDRRGRVVGNLRALGDLLRNRLTPARVLEL